MLAPGQPAIVTEIYLPQKYALSPRFVQALTDVMLPWRVQAHFEETLDEAVINCLPPHFKEKDKYENLKRLITHPKEPPARSFSGYTMYPIMGGFRDDRASDPKKRIVYDANICVRLIDTASNENVFRNKNDRPDEDLFQRVVRTVFGLRRHHGRQPPLQMMSTADDFSVKENDDSSEARRVRSRLNEWIDESSFLLYGFLGYRLVEATDGAETSILLTSHFAIESSYWTEKAQLTVSTTDDTRLTQTAKKSDEASDLSESNEATNPS
jgi:hypothetical protein